jgi:PPOX class probable F420-dependent enzyme
MFDAQTRALLDGPNYAAFTSVLPNGQLATQIMWVGDDGGHVLINTKEGRQKVTNVANDPRVTVTVFHAGSPTLYSEIRGKVVEVIGEPEAREHFNQLSIKYTGGQVHSTPGERVLFRIEPERVRVHDGRPPLS